MQLRVRWEPRLRLAAKRTVTQLSVRLASSGQRPLVIVFAHICMYWSAPSYPTFRQTIVNTLHVSVSKLSEVCF